MLKILNFVEFFFHQKELSSLFPKWACFSLYHKYSRFYGVKLDRYQTKNIAKYPLKMMKKGSLKKVCFGKMATVSVALVRRKNFFHGEIYSTKRQIKGPRSKFNESQNLIVFLRHPINTKAGNFLISLLKAIGFSWFLGMTFAPIQCEA